MGDLCCKLPEDSHDETRLSIVGIAPDMVVDSYYRYVGSDVGLLNSVSIYLDLLVVTLRGIIIDYLVGLAYFWHAHSVA